MLVYIHAGMHKTGTTHIQHSLAENRRALSRLGVGVWPGSVNHTSAALALAGAPRPRAAEAAPKLARRVLDDIARSRRRGMRAYLLVGEGIGANLTAEAAARLRAALGEVSDGARAIVYLREPVSYVAAMRQEHVKAGGALADAPDKARPPRYRRRVEGLLSAMPEHLTIRLYDRARLTGGDALADFLGWAGLGDVTPRLTPARAGNRTLSVEAAHVWERVVRRAPEARRWPLRQKVEDVLSALPGRPFRLSAEAAARVLAETAKDRAWLTEALGRDPFHGAPPPPAGSIEWNVGEGFIDFLADMVLEVARARADRADSLARRLALAFGGAAAPSGAEQRGARDVGT